MASLLGFEVRVAVRFLREGRLQTALIMVGVAAGVAVIAYISALVTGLQSNTFTKTLGGQPHVTLRALEDVVTPARRVEPGASVLTETQPRAQRLRSVGNWQSLLPVLEQMPEVAAVSPMVAGGGLALRGEATQSIALAGVDLDRYDRVVRLRDK
ncbi:MAG: ABC transporter permease, partial [Rhodoferax sp.]|nr:ABC transporter permease [Rhodoferax sp.]